MRARLVTIVGDLDPSGLATTTDLHLCLDHAWVADLVGGGDRVLDCAGRPPARNGDAVACEQLLALVLE